MPRKVSRKSLVKKLDTIFSLYVRLHNADDKGFCKCVTCDTKYHYKDIHAGHFMSRKFYSTRWEEQNVFPQCPSCNLFRFGEQYKFSRYLGKATSDLMYKKSKEIVKFSNVDLIEKIEHYKSLVDNYSYKK